MFYIQNDITGLQMAQVAFAGTISGIWVDCIGCGRRDRLAGEDTKHVSDERAKRTFESKGWSVTPTVCPECRNAA